MSTHSPFFTPPPVAISRLLPESFDLGRPALGGEVVYDAQEQSYVVVGAGTNMWAGTDEGHLAARRLNGDGVVAARAAFVGTGGHAHRKLGATFRSSPDGCSVHVSAVVHADGLTSLQFRREPGGPTHELVSSLVGADVMQLERVGRRFVMRVARFGAPWVSTVLEDGPELGAETLAGVFVCSHEASVTERAVFHNVRVFRIAGPELRPYRDYLDSELELLNPESGYARVIWRQEGELQAPNWAPDGRSIDCNRAGRILRLDLATGTMATVDTGLADRNNNDHVRSPDSALIGLSHHTGEAGGGSRVFVVPTGGGEPRLVTTQGLSYLHGWSPDGSRLIYTAKRPETGTALNIYRIPVEGGAEERLSDGPGLDDGSEYSPDGRWIYFNSNRSGVMKIWRMRPDGSGVEQVTHDEFNDWFPHVSPDGRRMAFISYLPEVPAGDHPFYKQVYLRICELEDDTARVEAPRVVAYVHGGQGSFNVPCWSPDGRVLAFVSNGGVG
ncbi:MAG: TolB family protein [Burkholderiales bacterium]|nr:TolB family protein [Opitutaceae bacterium]